jgi:hypothetical protein
VFKKGLVSILAMVPWLFAAAPAIHADGVNCTISNGFATLDGMMVNQVGGCLTNPYQISNGNTVQETVGGLLSFNPSDSMPKFTDGINTWVLGPDGLQERANGDHFAYEAPDTQVAGVVITNQPVPNVTGCLKNAINADGIDHPTNVQVILTAAGGGNANC